MGINLPKLRTSIHPCFLELLHFRGDITFLSQNITQRKHNHFTIVLFSILKRLLKFCANLKCKAGHCLRGATISPNHLRPLVPNQSNNMRALNRDLYLSLWAVCPPLSSAFILSCSASLSPSVFPFSNTFVCTQPFYLCKLGDTTFSWTWLALSQLSYGLLFHKHRHYFSSLLLSPLSPPTHPPLTCCLQQLSLKLMCNSMTPLTEVFNSFSTAEAAEVHLFLTPFLSYVRTWLKNTCIKRPRSSLWAW